MRVCLGVCVPYTIDHCAPLCTRRQRERRAAVPARTQDAETTIIGKGGCVAGGIGTAGTFYSECPSAIHARSARLRASANRQVCVRVRAVCTTSQHQNRRRTALQRETLASLSAAHPLNVLSRHTARARPASQCTRHSCLRQHTLCTEHCATAPTVVL